MATEAQIQQTLVDVHAYRIAFNRILDQITADANAYSIQQRGRPLPNPNQLGQLPPSGVVITTPPPEGGDHERGG